MKLYHSTSFEAAAAILRDGFRDGTNTYRRPEVRFLEMGKSPEPRLIVAARFSNGGNMIERTVKTTAEEAATTLALMAASIYREPEGENKVAEAVDRAVERARMIFSKAGAH